MDKIKGIIPHNFDQCQWHCVSNDIYIFGTTKENIIDDKYALIERQPDEGFDWEIIDTRFRGCESNKSLAMGKVEKLFYSAIELRESLK